MPVLSACTYKNDAHYENAGVTYSASRFGMVRGCQNQCDVRADSFWFQVALGQEVEVLNVEISNHLGSCCGKGDTLTQVSVAVDSSVLGGVASLANNNTCGGLTDIYGPGSFGAALHDDPALNPPNGGTKDQQTYVRDLETPEKEVNPNDGPTRFLHQSVTATQPYHPPGRTPFHAPQTHVFHCPPKRRGRYIHIRSHSNGHHQLVCEVELTIKFKTAGREGHMVAREQVPQSGVGAGQTDSSQPVSDDQELTQRQHPVQQMVVKVFPSQWRPTAGA